MSVFFALPVVTEEERNRCKNQLCFVEQELAASKGRENALQQQLLKEVADSQERYRIQVQRCSELEVHLDCQRILEDCLLFSLFNQFI